jgi:hypothetical protein
MLCSEHMCEKEEIPPPFSFLMLLSQQQLHRRQAPHGDLHLATRRLSSEG